MIYDYFNSLFEINFTNIFEGATRYFEWHKKNFMKLHVILL